MKIRNMTVKEVQEETGESLQSIRVKIQRQLVDYGIAFKLPR